MRQLGGLDASFLYMETPQTPMHVGGLYLFELPEGYQGDFYENFRAHLTRRLHLAPILSKKLSAMPLEMDHPVWVDAGELDLDYHLRRSGLPRPGRMAQLEDLVGRLHSVALDRGRPLWEFHIIDGLETGHAVLYTKVHHAAIDGGAGMELTKALYDVTPTPREVEPPPPRDQANAGTGQPNLLGLLGAAYTGYLRQQVRNLQMIPEAWRALAKAVLPDAQSLRYQPFATPPLTAPKTIINGTIDTPRSFAARSVPLEDAKRIAKQTGAKLNDVVLAVCSGALRRYLQEKQALPDQSLTAFVPVSLREVGNTEANNQVFGMICSLATDVADPLERLRAIVASSQQAKQLTGNIKDIVPRDYSVLGAPLLLQGLMGLYGRSRLADQMPLAANVTISNVPGPAVALYAAGAKMLTMYPVSIPSHGLALNITVQSYNGALDFGLITCRSLLPDVRSLTDYVVEALAELKAAAVAHAAGPEQAADGARPRPRASSKPGTPTAEALPAIEAASPAPAARRTAAKPGALRGRIAKTTAKAVVGTPTEAVPAPRRARSTRAEKPPAGAPGKTAQPRERPATKVSRPAKKASSRSSRTRA